VTVPIDSVSVADPDAAATHDAALVLGARHGYHIYDATIVAAALEGECSVLYSEDLHDGQVIAG
jgi:predicted nucleic acid-binding protein